MQDPQAPRDGKPTDEPAIRPVYGRAGRGVASIVPHLCRQQQINDKPAAPDDLGGPQAKPRGGDRPR